MNRLTLSRPIQVNLRVRVTEVSRNITQQLGINWSALGGAGNFVGGLFNGRTLFDPTNGLFNLSPTGAFSVLGGFRAGAGRSTWCSTHSTRGAITMLAEPNLTAMSGETASFLAGGEIRSRSRRPVRRPARSRSSSSRSACRSTSRRPCSPTTGSA